MTSELPGQDSFRGFLEREKAETPHTHISDKEILAIEDPRERTEACFREYGKKIYNYVMQKLRYDADTAATITQETFLSLHKKFQDKNNPIIGSLSGYLYRIADNLIISYHRKKKPVVMEHLREDVDTRVLLDLDKKLLFEAIKKLGEEQRVVIEKKYQGLTNLEIAEDLGITEGAVKARYNRAKAELARLLAHDFPERKNNPAKKESKK